MKKYKCIKIETISYNDAFFLQKALQDKVLKDDKEQYILALSHKDVITTGKRGFLDNLKYDYDFYEKNNIELIESDRGGLTTYHGPGQLVLYFILNLLDLSLGIKNFITKIEDSIIETLVDYDINAKRIDGFRGVFVGNNKIAAIGMEVKHNVTSHGIALNISTNLSKFDLFTPCGLLDKGITSLEKELNKCIDFNEVLLVLIDKISHNLEVEIER
jgi:lipoyl(octanoyl) transferase